MIDEESPTYIVMDVENHLKAYAECQMDSDGRKLATMLEEDLNGLLNSAFPIEVYPQMLPAYDDFAKAIEENKMKFKESYTIWSCMIQNLTTANRLLEKRKSDKELNGQEQKLVVKCLDRLAIVRGVLYPKGTTFVRNFW